MQVVNICSCKLNTFLVHHNQAALAHCSTAWWWQFQDSGRILDKESPKYVDKKAYNKALWHVNQAGHSLMQKLWS